LSNNVLVISSSPRKGGNSDILTDEFIKGATESGNKVEKVFLKNKNINYCTGCGVCVTNNYTACSQKDDMSELLEKMVEFDVIVMATPIYFYTMCAQMKTFIHRCCARYTHIKNKEFYFIMTSADGRRDAQLRTLEGFKGFLACLDGAVEKGTIYGVGLWHKDEVKSTDYMSEAYKMGKSV